MLRWVNLIKCNEGNIHFFFLFGENNPNFVSKYEIGIKIWVTTVRGPTVRGPTVRGPICLEPLLETPLTKNENFGDF